MIFDDTTFDIENQEKQHLSVLFFHQRAKKSMTFLHASKRHIFCEAQLHKKPRYARQKALTGVFDGYLSNLRRDLSRCGSVTVRL